MNIIRVSVIFSFECFYETALISSLIHLSVVIHLFINTFVNNTFVSKTFVSKVFVIPKPFVHYN